VTTLPSNPADWVNLYGDVLYRYALVRVHNQHLAEDLVQETLLAGLKAHDRFAGKASEQTWLIGILKHKIIDQFRKDSREVTQDVDDDDFYRNMEASFDDQGQWQVNIRAWSKPDSSLERDQFWMILSGCVDRLPPRLARLFVLRDLDGVASDEICQVLDISTSNNLWVMLSRMRLQLRNCLDVHWFNKSES